MGVCDSQTKHDLKPMPRKLQNYMIPNGLATKTPISEDYDMKVVIGSGATGTVYIGTNNEGKKFAIKSIDKSTIKDPKYLINEVKINKAVNHENIVKCYGIYEDDKNIHFVLQLINSGTLLDFIKNSPNGHLDDITSLELITQILQVLDYLHNEKMIVHRDIKPENFLVVIKKQRPHLKIIDFGFACPIPRECYMYDTVGTPSYMAPEMIEESKYSRMADLWSTGVLFYNMITGYRPFVEEEGETIQDKIVNSKVNFDIIENKDLRELCQGLLEKHPDFRLNAHKALAKALEIQKKFGINLEPHEKHPIEKSKAKGKYSAYSSRKTSVSGD